MEVYEFEKCLSTCLDECTNVLQCTGSLIPASQVRSEWAYQIGLKIEPTGWSALWKIPRILCEEYNIKYPTVVYGTVKQVLFKELKATFTVDLVQDDDVHLPEEYEVRLEDLWPTKVQENSALDVEGTANCIDSLRFFYKNIWMPWDLDNDDDIDWSEKYLESRIRFYYDLKKEINRPMASHIKRLMNEARYLQQRKEALEMELDGDGEDEDAEYEAQIFKLMPIHLRMTAIKNKIELLENPKSRTAFVNVDENQLKDDLSIGDSDKDYIADNCIFIVANMSNLDNQICYLETVRKIVGGSIPIKFCSSLQNCLETSKSSNEIYIPAGVHSIKYLEYLNEKGLIYAVCSVENQIESRIGKEIKSETDSIIRSYDEDSMLLMFDSDFVIKNVILDCRNVRQGILIRKGTIRLENCTIIGDSKSSTNQGIAVLGGASLHLVNTVIKEFSTGINCLANSSVIFDNSLIYGCHIGIDCSENCSLNFKLLEIMKCKRYGMSYTSTKLPDSEKKIIVNNLESIVEKPFTGKCIFESNAAGNIAMYNKSKMLLNDTLTLMDIDESAYDFSLNYTTAMSQNNIENGSFISSDSSIHDDSLANNEIINDSVTELE